MYDLMIRNGMVVTPLGVWKLDIAIKDGKIAALSGPGMSGSREADIDASGKYVFPGGIDIHVHIDDLGAKDIEDWRHGSYAAACGGVTTIVDMPIDCVPATVNRQAMKEKLSIIQGNSYVDYMLWGGLTTDNRSEIDGMLAEGAVGLKAFLTDSGAADYKKTEDAVLFEAMKKAAEDNFPIMIHAENQEMNEYYEMQYKGSKDWKDWSKMHPRESELEAVERCILFAGSTGARVHLAHLSCVESIQKVVAAKSQGLKITCETCPHYLMFCEEDYVEKGGLLKCSPPVRVKENQKKLWERLKNGDIDIISSDHSPSVSKDSGKLREASIDTVWAGVSGIQNTLYVLYSEGHLKKRVSLERIAEVFSLNAAKLLGIDEYKGSIEVGKDADLVILNPDIDTQFDEGQIKTKLKNSVYRGSRFHGFIEQTFLRGSKITGNALGGHYICR